MTSSPFLLANVRAVSASHFCACLYIHICWKLRTRKVVKFLKIKNVGEKDQEIWIVDEHCPSCVPLNSANKTQLVRILLVLDYFIITDLAQEFMSRLSSICARRAWLPTEALIVFYNFDAFVFAKPSRLISLMRVWQIFDWQFGRDGSKERVTTAEKSVFNCGPLSGSRGVVTLLSTKCWWLYKIHIYNWTILHDIHDFQFNLKKNFNVRSHKTDRQLMRSLTRSRQFFTGCHRLVSLSPGLVILFFKCPY